MHLLEAAQVHMFKGFLLFSLLLTSSAFATELTLSFGGDLGLSASGSEALANAGNKHGATYELSTLVAGLRPLWDADINFANMEAVVSSRKLPSAGKKYSFKTHPLAVQKLATWGLNLYSTANNHTYDYLDEGVLDTLQHMQKLEAEGYCNSAGVGATLDEALQVKIFNIKGYRIAFGAIGILSENNTSHRAGANKAGTASYRQLNSQTRSGPDYDALLARMKNVQADLKILSIHFGTEGRTSLDVGQREDFQKAITEGDVDVVLGHHAHVVRPWEVIEHGGRNRVIFYGLGNYLHLGTAAVDYGLYGKLFFSPNAQGRLEAQALKLVALTQTHLAARPHDVSAHQSRMKKLNQMNVAHFGKNTLTTEDIPQASYSRSCWGNRLGFLAKTFCF